MENLGPPLEDLIRRLSETPEVFLGVPTKEGLIFTQPIVLVIDFLYKSGIALKSETIKEFEANFNQKDHCILAKICVWLLNHDFSTKINIDEKLAKELFINKLSELSKLRSPIKFLNDHDRKEELARIILASLNYRPAGETVNQAKDRLSSLNSIERKKLLNEISAIEKRSREIREALSKKLADESADKTSRE